MNSILFVTQKIRADISERLKVYDLSSVFLKTIESLQTIHYVNHETLLPIKITVEQPGN